MKKLISIILLLIIALSVCGCEKDKEAVSVPSQYSKPVSSDVINETPKSSSIDVDLTQLNSTMIYSKVLNMMNEPQTFLGKSIKMQGAFSKYVDEETKKVYYSCIIKDATACCQQGIEFVLKDGNYPQKEGEDITVIGTFNTYEEGEYIYSQLKDAAIIS